MSWRAIAIAASVALGATAATARADIGRYAVVVGNNTGDRDDAQLRYAERDAERFAAALIDLGGFPAANVVVLDGRDAETMRASVIAVNDRIRSEHHAETMLVVYYSGHADASDLHLGHSTLAISQLEQLVRGSAASFRLLALDSCRSGVLTRVKGGSLAPPIPITVGDSLEADGVLFWAASAASEDAQESDDIQGSFFTHFLVSGLAGPADADGDGKVTTSEAFEHARVATLRASSRTLAGPQHATFRDEFRGRQEVVLTTPRGAAQMATLVVPRDRDVLVLAESETGRVVGEISAPDTTRALTVRAGRYFVRERADGYLLEGTITVGPGAPRQIADDELHRVAYAALVRKGGHGRQDEIEVGFAAQSSVLGGNGACMGPTLGYAIALPWISVTPELQTCHEALSNSLVSTAAIETGAAIEVTHVWDLRRVGLSLGAEAGGEVIHESFTTSGHAPARNGPALSFGALGKIEVQLIPGLTASAEIAALTFVLHRVGLADVETWATPLVVRGSLSLGVAW